MSVQTTFGSPVGSRNIRSSKSDQATSSITDEYRERSDTDSGALRPMYFRCHAGSNMLQDGTSAKAS